MCCLQTNGRGLWSTSVASPNTASDSWVVSRSPDELKYVSDLKQVTPAIIEQGLDVVVVYYKDFSFYRHSINGIHVQTGLQFEIGLPWQTLFMWTSR